MFSTGAPLRALSGPRRRGGDTLAGGRWSRVADLRRAAVSPTEQALARTQVLLQRYGLVSREMVRAEGLPGGFGGLYPILKQLEQGGRVRRGYFVEGLSGAQFAQAGTVDRLRAARSDEAPLEGFGPDTVRVLPALDPANPYGALLPWPAPAGGRVGPKRVAGAWVILVAGQAVFWLGPRGRQLLALAGSTAELRVPAIGGLHRIAPRGRFLIEKINGMPAEESPLAPELLANGFARDYRGLTRVPGGAGKP